MIDTESHESVLLMGKTRYITHVYDNVCHSHPTLTILRGFFSIGKPVMQVDYVLSFVYCSSLHNERLDNVNRAKVS